MHLGVSEEESYLDPLPPSCRFWFEGMHLEGEFRETDTPQSQIPVASGP